ncbi:unnamed protein product [Lota lota]
MCAAHLSGWVNSPGFPRGYQPLSKLEWTKCAPKAHLLTLSLTHLDLEDSHNCENDALEIYSDGQKIVRLCGKKTLEELQSSVNPLLQSSASGCLSLTFRSDYSNPERHTGFRAFYTVQDFDECEYPSGQECSHFCHNFVGGHYCSCRLGYVLDEDQHTCTVRCSKDLSGSLKGRISSPFRPYPDNSRCLYTLSVEPHLQFELEFSAAFDVEQGPDGECRDSLTVETRSGMLGPFCGGVAPPSPLLTHSNHIVIHFNSDNYGSNNGFTLFYRTKGQTCLGTVTPNSSVTPMHPVYHHGDRVTVTCDIGRRADTPKEFLSQYVTTCQKTGTWSPSYTCDILTCDLPDIRKDILQLKPNQQSTSFGDQIQFECSSKYYTLEGHDTYTCDASGDWVSLDGRKTLPRCTEVCGKTTNDTSDTGRILGGTRAKAGEIPWQLSVKGRSLAGASLIGDRWALTAAHVVDNNADLELYGGVFNLAQTNPTMTVVQHPDRLLIDKITIHPNYKRNIANRGRVDFDNDIALIRLATRATLGPNLCPICLPEAQGGLEDGMLGSVSGWGMTEDKGVSQILRHAPISVYSSAICENTPKLGATSMLYTENMFCAGAEGKDSCSRDSGGPFFVPRLGEGNRNGRGPYRIEGIVSWGADCKDRQFKGYYTMVGNYVGWIRETIQKRDFNYSNLDMGRPNCIIWLLCVFVCECVSVVDVVWPNHGMIQSPDFPQPYGPNLLKRWDLRVAEGYQIQLTFTHMDIEATQDCRYDAVLLSDDKKLLGKFCGQENSPDGNQPGNQPILSPGNKMSLVFQTDNTNSEQHKGFLAHYQAIDIDECAPLDPDSEPLCSHICHNTLGSYLCSCHHGYELRPDQHTCVASCVGGVFSELTGHLSSPGFPDASLRKLDCQYLISVEPGFTITLNFTSTFHIESIEVEEGLSCLHHWLQVTVQDQEPVRLCGDQSPGLMATNSNNVTLDYHTDSEGMSNGWSLHYSTQRVSCPFPGSMTNGRVTPAFTQYFYKDYIHIRCDQGYKLMMYGREINSSFIQCQSNGEWHLPLPECQIIDCGEPEWLLNGGITFISGSDYQYLSVIKYHCDEPYYTLRGEVEVSFTCTADRKWRDNNDVPAVPICLPVCGKPRVRAGQVGRILGGKVATPYTFPWQVLLNVNGRGGGIVIGDRWIMTAAHNLVHNGVPVDKDQVEVRGGNNDVEHLTKGAAASIASLHVHNGYNNPNDINYDNDIALIKLQSRLTFNSSIMPICLPPEGAIYEPGELGLVSGFGVSEKDGKSFISNKLMFFSPPIVSQETCRDSLVGESHRLTDNMLCAGMPDGKSDACQGDSGSALAIMHEGNYYAAAGIVSWGINCNTRGKYGVYTRVVNYLEWIKKTMDDNDI